MINHDKEAMRINNDDYRGEVVRVLYVAKQDAKRIKTILEEHQILNKDFRLQKREHDQTLLAVPILEDCDLSELEVPELLVREEGRQFCLYSTSMLGNHQHRKAKRRNNHILTTTDDHLLSMTLVQRALWKTMKNRTEWRAKDDRCLLELISQLPVQLCPRTVELLGDDSTVVLNRGAFDPQNHQFEQLVKSEELESSSSFFEQLWENLAQLYQSKRVVRKGPIDPNSPIRESGYRLLWVHSSIQRNPSWITVTEQGIRQSFDLTRVMFSRGNITEKIRFGKLVQPGEIVLDLYAGIGYFSLPALVHGGAEHLFACEWNEYAIQALKYNLSDNGVEERTTILQGDCRKVTGEYGLVDKVDRVSLGLIPSSEGGWKTAVRAIRRSTGGWLHVHGNVKVIEVKIWGMWLCWTILGYVQGIGYLKHWKVVCPNIEKVKSFAPTVAHYVADIYLGPDQDDNYPLVSLGEAGCNVGDNRIETVTLDSRPDPPSCAISRDGPISQEWMAGPGIQACNRI